MSSSHSIASRAEAHCHSYATSISRASQRTAPNDTIDTRAVALAILSHYHTQTFTAFTLGTRSTLSTTSEENPITAQDKPLLGIKTYLDRFIHHGLPLDNKLEKLRVEVVSDLGAQGGGFAFCWITWRMEPGVGSPWEGRGWSWENVYGFRVMPAGAGGAASAAEGFESVVSDNEVVGLVGRVPGFMERLGVVSEDAD